MIDTPGAAVDLIKIGGKLQRFTRRFRIIGLSGYRPLTSNAKHGSVTKNTPLDHFLSDTRRQENQQISLWDWAKICNCRKNCGADHVPVFTGIATCAIWPVSEEYAKGQLMIFS